MKPVFLMLFITCMHQDTSFLNKVLKDFDRNSLFIAINVKSSNYSGPVVIENDDLYYFFSQTKKLNEEQYQALVKDKINSHSFFDIGNASLAKWNFIKVPQLKTVNQNAAKGVEKFIKTYFHNNVLKDGISNNQRAAIINKLFEWKIATAIDDETGYLVIRK